MPAKILGSEGRAIKAYLEFENLSYVIQEQNIISNGKIKNVFTVKCNSEYKNFTNFYDLVNYVVHNGLALC